MCACVRVLVFVCVSVWFGQVVAAEPVVRGACFIKTGFCLIISLNILCPLVKVIIGLFDALDLC